jgi:hypothetical protein
MKRNRADPATRQAAFLAAAGSWTSVSDRPIELDQERFFAPLSP